MNYDHMIRRYRQWRSLPEMFFDQALLLGDKAVFAAKRGGRFEPVSWRQAAGQVRALARALRKLGIAPGDRVVLVSENRPEFAIADLGIMAAGAITVPAYVTNTVQDHLYVLENSGACAAIVSTRPLAERVLAAAQMTAACRSLIAIEPWLRGQTSAVDVLSWADFLESAAADAGDVAAWVAALDRRDTACIIYTSGTGGVPKGVMLSHGAILSNCMGAYDLLFELGLDDEVFLSFLPLSHSYEHTAGQFFPLSIGACICYAEGVESLGKNMVEARPTLMTSVPRLYESLHRRILANVERAGPLSRYLFNAAVALGKRAYEAPGSLSIRERLADLALDVLVRRKLRKRFGGRLKAFVSGGAPLAYDIGLFFTALGVRLLQGYGQTESAPVISCNAPARNRIGTVGAPLLDVEVALAEDGEILVQGELVMQGYWRDEPATAAAIREGWLYTGDIGTIDDHGTITITDRKKDIIVNSGGDNVSPLRVEGRLTLEPEIGQAMVFGDRKPHLVAVIVPDADFARSWGRSHGQGEDWAAFAADAAFHRALAAAVQRANDSLSPIEHVRRFVVAPEPFTIENGLLTPTLKLRRYKIRELYGARLEALYGAG
ncbi:MAG TPA: long-chain fatty acid--CoA ligase [Alphaproteobacteria bacterium]|nr:long-chain fatty acid--CoA ligase [Alphaproteobacteria bacterium]